MAVPKSLSAKLLVEDIRGGMNGRDLMTKYEITPVQLQKAVEKLVAARMITFKDLARQAPVAERIVQIAFRCPACDAPQTKVVAECPQCGVIVEKYLKRKQAKVPETKQPPSTPPEVVTAPSVAAPAAAAVAVEESSFKCPACGKVRSKSEPVCPHCSKMMSDEAARREAFKKEVEAAPKGPEHLYKGIDADKHRGAAKAFLDKTDWTEAILKDTRARGGGGAEMGSEVGGVAADVVLGILFGG